MDGAKQLLMIFELAFEYHAELTVGIAGVQPLQWRDIGFITRISKKCTFLYNVN